MPNPEVPLFKQNLATFAAVLALKAEIRKNLLEMFRLFGFDPDNPVVTPDDEGSQLLKLDAIALALAIEDIQLETVLNALAALKKCLQNVSDPKEAEKLADLIETLTDVCREKITLKHAALEWPVNGAPSTDPDEKEGMRQRDSEIVRKLIEMIAKLDEQVSEIRKLKKKLTKLDPDQGGDAEAPAPKPAPDDLTKELDKIAKDYEEQLKQAQEREAKAKDELMKRVAEACERGKLGDVMPDVSNRLHRLLDRNVNLARLIEETAIPEERRALKRAKRLIEAIRKMIQTEIDKIDKAIERDKAAIEDEPELAAAKLNLLVQLKGIAAEQEAELFEPTPFAQGEDEKPKSIEDRLGAKERSTARAAEQVKGVKDKIDEMRKKLPPIHSE